MSRKKKKRRGYNNKRIPKKIIETQSPLAEEVVHIENKIKNEEKDIYELNLQKRIIKEDIVDRILLNNELTELIDNYCTINKEIIEKKEAQERRKLDLKNKKTKLDINPTVKKEVLDYMKIGDANHPVGLYNSICKYPVAICMQKNVYLSYQDIRYKNCLKHRDHKPCKHLQWLNSEICMEDK